MLGLNMTSLPINTQCTESKSPSKRIVCPFSQELLSTLYYKTDVGCIPRVEDSTLPHSSMHSYPNSSVKIDGCYWCGREKTSVQGMCCSQPCIFYFHEWCVLRSFHFTNIHICKLPGCSTTSFYYEFCSEPHFKEYQQMYSFITKKQLAGLIIKGPSWYVSDHTEGASSYQRNIIASTPSVNVPKMDVSPKLRVHLIYDTDVGPIPRSSITTENKNSKFFTHNNWNTDIRGCYQCGQTRSRSSNEFLCSGKCYMIFHEWCRLKVLTGANMNFCQQLGCAELAQKGYNACSETHSKCIQDNFINYRFTSSELASLVSKGPYWYKNPDTSGANGTSTPNPVHNPPKETRSVFYIFSQTLTEWMYKESDIGPIPRSLLTRFPEMHSINKDKSPNNWDADIPMCYWCCCGDANIHGIACSDKCFFLFNEWCHKKYYKSTSKRLCKHLSCNSSTYLQRDCCIGDHSTKYAQKFSTKFSFHLRSTEYFLGPKWYWDKSVKSIDFYNREDPFYEFANFYLCPRLRVDGRDWTTTEHYFQAQKFPGTPHVECVRKLSTAREAFDYTRRSELQKWIRPDWAGVKERVMLKVLEEKFSQNEGLAHILIQTGDAHIYEHTRNDRYWGDGGDRKGKNILGKLLMQVRFDLYNKCPFLPSRLEHLKLSVTDTSHKFHTSTPEKIQNACNSADKQYSESYNKSNVSLYNYSTTTTRLDYNGQSHYSSFRSIPQTQDSSRFTPPVSAINTMSFSTPSLRDANLNPVPYPGECMNSNPDLFNSGYNQSDRVVSRQPTRATAASTSRDNNILDHKLSNNGTVGTASNVAFKMQLTYDKHSISTPHSIQVTSTPHGSKQILRPPCGGDHSGTNLNNAKHDRSYEKHNPEI